MRYERQLALRSVPAMLAYWIIGEEPRNELLVGAFWEHMVEGTHVLPHQPGSRVSQQADQGMR